MEEKSVIKKAGILNNPNVHRLSESRPIFMPVLVKTLLADESDDDSDEQVVNSDNSDEEFDDFDGCQPLPDECADDPTTKTLVTNSDVKIDIAVKDEELSSARSREEVYRVSVSSVNKESIISEHKAVLNSYLKDSLRICDYSAKNSEEDKLMLDKPISGAKRKSSKDLDVHEHSATTMQSQLQSNLSQDDKRHSLPVKEQSQSILKPRSYSPDLKRHNTVIKEVKDRPGENNESFTSSRDNQEPCRHSSSNINKVHSISNDIKNEKVPLKAPMDQISNTRTSSSFSVLNTTNQVMGTPMKHPQGSARPNPCLSHRNIFQTPQNKIGNDFTKTSIQTPATIFSHWSQRHLAQTPMQIPSTRETIQTPATNIVQSHSSKHETPRYSTEEGKSARRPLAEVMYSDPVHGPQHARLHEVSNESQPSPPISKDSNILLMQDNLVDKKPVYSSSSTTKETKENHNPHAVIKNDNYVSNQGTVIETRHSMNPPAENKTKIEYHNPYHTNMQPSRTVEKYESYQARESAPAPVKNQPEQMTIQCSIPQQTSNSWSSRKKKIITVDDRQYLVLSVLGQGMSSEVVRALDLSSSAAELRAIKCVNLSKMNKDSAQGCLQEICMLDRLKAPCIVHMYNFEIKQPLVHVVMEIGDTDLSSLLKSMLKEKKQIPLTMILYYWTEMLTAVKHIHNNGVIHSDLKPANFLLVRGRLKLIDFGIASNINADMTSVVKNCSIGTLNYISPEALMDVSAGNADSPNHNVKYKISYKSDVWSLGCILYGLVYGVTPFNHIRQQWAKISAITDPKYNIKFPLTTGSLSVPLILIDVMRKCLKRDPKARPTVADLLEIPYLQSNISPCIVPKIPSNILMKIKQAVSDEEWKQFTEVLDSKTEQ